MNKKVFTLLLFFGFLSMNVFAQKDPVREKIDKVAKDPRTEERAAKADVYLHRHNIGADSVKTRKANPTTAAADKKKKKPHKKSFR